jgi:hypothetical protein
LNIQELKIKRKIYSEQIKSLKNEMKSSNKQGNYFIPKYKEKNDEFWLKYGYGFLGVGRNNAYKIHSTSIDIRTINILIAYLTNKKFSDVEKYYYNNSIQYQYILLVKDSNEYSKYIERKYKQSKALDQCRILLGSFQINHHKVTHNKKTKLIETKKALPHEAFDKWVNDTSVLA